jgi:hypothetical protein
VVTSFQPRRSSLLEPEGSHLPGAAATTTVANAKDPNATAFKTAVRKAPPNFTQARVSSAADIAIATAIIFGLFPWGCGRPSSLETTSRGSRSPKGEVPPAQRTTSKLVPGPLDRRKAGAMRAVQG